MNIVNNATRCACCLRPEPDPGETDGEVGFVAGLASCLMLVRTGELPLCSRHADMVKPMLSAVSRFRWPAKAES